MPTDDKIIAEAIRGDPGSMMVALVILKAAVPSPDREVSNRRESAVSILETKLRDWMRTRRR